MSDISLAPAGTAAKSRLVRRDAADPRVPSDRLKICFISETLQAGVGRHIVDVAPALSRRGHEVHLIYSPIRADPAFVSAIKTRSNVRCHAVAMPRAIG